MISLGSKPAAASPEYKSNSRHHRKLADDLKARLERIRVGGSKAAIATQRKRGKLLARERIARLLDPDTPFLELSGLAAWELHGGSAPAAGVVTGIGRISGRECMLVVNDPTVKAGTYFPETIKKHIRAQEIALDNRLPCVYLVDSGGVFLPLQADVFPDKEHFGRIFYNQAIMSSLGISQIAVVNLITPQYSLNPNPLSWTGVLNTNVVEVATGVADPAGYIYSCGGAGAADLVGVKPTTLPPRPSNRKSIGGNEESPMSG